MKHEKPIPMKPGGKAMPPKVNHDRVDSKKRSAYPRATIEGKRGMILDVTIPIGMDYRVGYVCF